jgi:hypothetical protein
VNSFVRPIITIRNPRVTPELFILRSNIPVTHVFRHVAEVVNSQWLMITEDEILREYEKACVEMSFSFIRTMLGVVTLTHYCLLRLLVGEKCLLLMTR